MDDCAMVQISAEELEKYKKTMEQMDKIRKAKSKCAKKYQKSERGVEKNRFYAKRYYHQNKEKVLQKRKDKYQQNKQKQKEEVQ
jgi:hypothetical protein